MTCRWHGRPAPDRAAARRGPLAVSRKASGGEVTELQRDGDRAAVERFFHGNDNIWHIGAADGGRSDIGPMPIILSLRNPSAHTGVVAIRNPFPIYSGGTMNQRVIKDITDFIFMSDAPQRSDVILRPGRPPRPR